MNALFKVHLGVNFRSHKKRTLMNVFVWTFKRIMHNFLQLDRSQLNRHINENAWDRIVFNFQSYCTLLLCTNDCYCVHHFIRYQKHLIEWLSFQSDQCILPRVQRSITSRDTMGKMQSEFRWIHKIDEDPIVLLFIVLSFPLVIISVRKEKKNDRLTRERKKSRLVLV